MGSSRDGLPGPEGDLRCIVCRRRHGSPPKAQMNTLAYLGFALEGAGRLYIRRFAERAREFALEPMGCKALLVLAEHGGVTQQRLSELTVLDPSTMGRLLDRLEARGLVERRPRRGDRRARSVALTQEAVAMLPSLWQAVRDSLRDALPGMSTSEQRCMLDALQRVLSNLSVRATPRGGLTALGSAHRHDGPPGQFPGSSSKRS